MSALTRRTLFAAALAAGLAGCTAAGDRPASGGSSPASGASGRAQLTVGLTYVPDIQFAPLYVADHFGWFAAEGVAVTLRHHGAQEKLLGALQLGQEDVVFAGGGEMLQARAEKIPVRNFATVFQQYPVCVIVPESSPIRSFADLKGRSIGLPGEYGENWFYTLAVLGQAGLSREDVSISSIGYTQLAALVGAKVDAVIGFENNDVIRFAEAKFPIRSLRLPDPPLVSVGFGALDTTLAARPDELAAMLRGVRRGAELCTKDPQQAVKIAEKYVPTLVEPTQQAHALAVLTATTKLFGTNFGVQDAGRWSRMSEFFLSQRLVSAPVAAAEAFTDQIVARLA